MKTIVGRDVLLSYPNFSQKFIIHTDSRNTQFWGIISQNEKTISFYSGKLTPAQINYIKTEKELLSMVETLKEFCTIILGHPITVYTDHKNITFENFTTERVLHWRLILEESGPEIKYIKGPDIYATGTLIIPLLIKSDVTESNITREKIAETYFVDQLDDDKFPIT